MNITQSITSTLSITTGRNLHIRDIKQLCVQRNFLVVTGHVAVDWELLIRCQGNDWLQPKNLFEVLHKICCILRIVCEF